jgi:hypothetical protein
MKRDKKSTKILTEWDKAIEDARKGIRRLEIAIEDCLAKKAAGEPWPGAQSSDHSKGQQHSV